MCRGTNLPFNLDAVQTASNSPGNMHVEIVRQGTERSWSELPV